MKRHETMEIRLMRDDGVHTLVLGRSAVLRETPAKCPMIDEKELTEFLDWYEALTGSRKTR